MTDVIGGVHAGGYRGDMAGQGDVQRLARALRRPRAGYVARIERTRKAVAARSVEAARQLDVFAGRIADLTIDELRELYDETFREGGPNALGPAVHGLTRGTAGQPEARTALDVLTPLLDRLDADRNPFAYVIRSLCCVLLVQTTRLPRAADDRTRERGSLRCLE